MPRPQNTKRLSLEDIHRALSKVMFGSTTATTSAPSKEVVSVESNETAKKHGVEIRTLKAVTSAKSTPLDEALQQYFVFPRPTEISHVEELVRLVAKLISLCGSNDDDWRVFVLTAFCRRYHAKAPEAKQQQAKDEAKADKDSDSAGDRSVGDGERLLFYITLLSLDRYCNEDVNAKLLSDTAATAQTREYAKAAMIAMIEIAAQIGGTRDLNSIIEALSFAALLRLGHVYVEGEMAAPGPFKSKFVPALQEMVATPLDAPLNLAVQLASQQLDQDFEKLEKGTLLGREKMDNEGSGGDSLLSTIHVTLPHNKRGYNSAQGWQRKLANCLAEALIWQRTSVAQNDQRFSRASKALLSREGSSIDQNYDLIQQMQTTIRKKRKLLNDHARTQGFMLASSYLSDSTSIRLKHIRRAKTGDLDMLQRLAKKRRDSQMLRLLLKRNLDPSKASHVESISQLAASWIPLPEVSKPDSDTMSDEITALELELQVASVNATVEYLRPRVKESASARPVLVISTGCDRDNAVCAILVAAALENSHLILSNGEEFDVSTGEKCLELLNQVIAKGALLSKEKRDGLSVEELISTKLDESQDMVVLSSSDLTLDEHVLQDLQARDITVRVHSTKRITASSQPVVLEINSEIHERLKAGASLSLAVVLDCTGSMGREIEACKKGAVKLISTFHDLAPVRYVNFMGYWDPVNVRSDPQPKSTGYLESNDIDCIQKFVNDELRCQGGGDEPEDIPAALEKLVEDVEKKGLSASTGVHFMFFIADAGFRSNENARVRAALETLKDLGIVMVMCPVRGKHGSIRTIVDRGRDCFQKVGQYVELENAGELETIAFSVTESIRASLFSAGNVVSVTSSIGDTIDSVKQLANFQCDHNSLRKAQELTELPPNDGKEATLSSDQEDKDEEEEVRKEELEVFAHLKEFKLTSRERLYLQLSRLPPICHETLESSFGGRSLQEIAAALIAERLVADNIPVAQIVRAGYPPDVVEIIRNMVGSCGVSRQTAYDVY